ncbi:MAG: flagellar M-ring protein FliF [candidate division Zixibacteria bacterium]|nr:flagellar M-ring protein FliF [candidate division Zixibacteria bacterium]
MNEFIEKIKTKLLPWWNSLSSGRKIIVVAAAGGAFLVIWLLSTQLIRANYQVLYRNLDSAEAGEVIDYLNESKTAYRLSDGGTAILVPSGKIHQVRLELASAGLPKSGIVGYEIFDQANLGMTEFLQKVNYRRALEGELAKTISRLEEIKTARIHMVIPESRLFKEDKKDPTASVVLYLNRNLPLSQRQVEGIIYLVASSVEGLTADNITILDSSGKLLTDRRSTDKLATLSSNQLDMQKNVEVYLENKAQSMLDGVLGANRSIVRISAALNFDQAERTIESYDPDNLSVRSEEISEEKGSETDSADPESKHDSSNSKKNTIRNYEVNKTIEYLVSQVGNLTRLNVSVSFDGSYEMVKGPDGSTSRQYVPRSQEELDKLVALVKGSVGFSEERTDVIEVANIPFETIQDDWEEKQRMIREEKIQYWMMMGFRLAVVFVILFILWRMRNVYKEWQVRRSARKRFMNAQAEVQRKAAELIPKVSKEPKLIDHVRQIAEDTPDEIAKAIKTIMVE